MRLSISLAFAGMLALPALEASSATYTFVGSWNMGDPAAYDDTLNPLLWTNNPLVFSGQEAAAFLFGGVASDYVISTISDQVADINFSAWLDGWGDEFTYGPLGTGPGDQGFSLDLSGLGYNGCETAQIDCTGSAYSALVYDHFPFSEGAVVNYAFRVAAIPIPAGGFLLIGALAGLGLLSRRRKS